MKIWNQRIVKSLGLALILASLIALAGCEPDGPMENAGEEIDDAVEDVQDTTEDAVDEVEDEVDEID